MPALTSDLRLLIIADNPFVRAGMASLLGEQSGLTIVGQSAGDLNLIDQVGLYSPDAIVWELPFDPELSLSQMTDLQEIRVPALVLISEDHRAADVLAAGAQGVLPQNSDAEVIAAALSALAHDLIVISPELEFDLPGNAIVPNQPQSDTLTHRELEVLRLVAEGLPNKQIAIQLSISEHTVKFHVNAIMGKLGVQSRTEAVVRATRLD